MTYATAISYLRVCYGLFYCAKCVSPETVIVLRECCQESTTEINPYLANNCWYIVGTGKQQLASVGIWPDNG